MRMSATCLVSMLVEVRIASMSVCFNLLMSHFMAFSARSEAKARGGKTTLKASVILRPIYGVHAMNLASRL